MSATKPETPCWNVVSRKPGVEWNDEDLDCVTDWVTSNYKYFLAFAFRKLRIADRRVLAAEAEDVLQDALRDLFCVYRFRTFDPARGNLSGYIHAAISHACQKAGRREPVIKGGKNYQISYQEGDREIELADDNPGGNPELALRTIEACRILVDCVNKLPPDYRNVLIRHYLEEQSIEEIAVALNISMPNVKIRLYRARHMVAPCLKTKGIVGGF
jgi:RNA polymerase sigma factor (sigma-70 family)